MSNNLAITEEILQERAPAIYGQGKLTNFCARVNNAVVGEVRDLPTKEGLDRIASQRVKQPPFCKTDATGKSPGRRPQ
ncbi:MAG: hypothetical protein CMQ34_07480 [Gammaproteobacteria bacterium]|nr:hypothetical protein [Gammaproteobacteria bacterium]|tara:strand:+ start:5325 stop:5558 length:234 start_codon:yes stop_codon:yes gene_type:complete